VSSFNLSKYEYRTSVPFVRWFFPNDSKDLESVVKGRGFLPEILLGLILVLSFNSWAQTSQSLGNLVIYFLWAIIVLLLFTLALANAKTMLLPNVLIKPLGIAVIIFQIVVAIQLNKISVLGNAVLGGLLLGGVPYVLFQLSAGKWIGGGDVKLGFVAGLLLGWKVGLFCLAVMVGLIGLSFLIEYTVSKISKTQTPFRIGTGALWAVAIMLSVVVGQQLIT
jgi:Flp pilus assembly protein protease CpaA